MRTAWITLGRLGDCVNTLPLVLHDYQQGNRPTFIASKPYESLLDGVTYCDRISWHGDYSRPADAVRYIESLGRYDQINVCQCYGTSHEFKCQSFAQEAWRLVGKFDLWGSLPLVFDQRSQQREQKLLEDFFPKGDKPVILVSADGLSSPFSGSKDLMKVLDSVSEKYDFVNIGGIRAERFYDLLALYEKAFALVAIDTGTLHLAQACPNLPVIALITDAPTMWHGSPERPNHAMRIRYRDFSKRSSELVELLRNPIAFSQSRIIHVWNDYNRDIASARRHSFAKRSWDSEYGKAGWRSCVARDEDFSRNTRTVCGESKAVPFVNDLIDRAADSCTPSDIIVLTNDDTVFTKGITDVILREIGQGPFWSGRMEHDRINSLPVGNVGDYKHCGADIFVFKKSWWLENRDRFPLMALSFEAWDLVLRTLINISGGREINPPIVAHEIHAPYWHSAKARECAANLFNRNAARRFFAANNMGWPKV